MRHRHILKRFLRWHPALRISVGVLLILIGLVGLAVPIMPQWPFLIAGMVLLLGDSSRLGRWLLLKIHRTGRWWRQRRQRRQQRGCQNPPGSPLNE